MSEKSKPGSFEHFVRWVGNVRRETVVESDPPQSVLAASEGAWRAYQDLQTEYRARLLARVREGRYYESIELMAAADTDDKRRLPRLCTPNGFAISALYPTNSPEGTAPVGVLVESPENLVGVFAGQPVHIFIAEQWIELGELDIEGNVIGDLPAGVEFKPPFDFHIGNLMEDPQPVPVAAEPK